MRFRRELGVLVECIIVINMYLNSSNTDIQLILGLRWHILHRLPIPMPMPTFKCSFSILSIIRRILLRMELELGVIWSTEITTAVIMGRCLPHQGHIRRRIVIMVRFGEQLRDLDHLELLHRGMLRRRRLLLLLLHLRLLLAILRLRNNNSNLISLLVRWEVPETEFNSLH